LRIADCELRIKNNTAALACAAGAVIFQSAIRNSQSAISI